jgi:hypothetical protein
VRRYLGFLVLCWGGVLNSFCAKGMDKFMENFSVWIDTRIPVKKEQKEKSINPIEIIKQHNNTVVETLDVVLMEFRRQSQEMFVTMSKVITHFTEFNEQQHLALKHLTNESRINVRLADSMESAVLGLRNESKAIRESLSVLPDVQREISENLRLVQSTLASTQESLIAGQERVGEHIGVSALHQERSNSSINQLVEAYATMVNLQERVLHNMYEPAQLNKKEDEKSETVEVVLEMQRTLQNQLNNASQWEDINALKNIKLRE